MVGERYDSADVCATFLRMHRLPTIALSAGSHQAVFKHRCVGSFTKSRLAAAAGTLPLVDVAAECLPEWRRFALQVGGLRRCVATFYGKLFSIAETPENAIRIVASCES